MRAIVTMFLLAISLSLSHAQPATQPLSETQKIDALIQHVENLKNAVFIRNDSEHSCRDAADHMRRKRRSAGSQIRTATDFIELAASKSSVSGKPYLIRFGDGRTVESGTYLREVLASLESPTTQPAK